jgi:cytochrome c-type biogenesis protein CcmH
MSIVSFLAIAAGAALALAWLLVGSPILARFGAMVRPHVPSIAQGGLGRALFARRNLAILALLPFAALPAVLAMRGETPATSASAPGQSNAVLERARKEAPHDLAGAVAQLEARLAREPEDVDGWRLLSRSYTLLGEPEKAAEAARRAAALDAGSGATASESATGEDLVTAAGGTVVPEARRHFEAALAADAHDPRARFFLGLAQAQDGNNQEALTRWLALEADSPADAPWLEGLRANIDRLAAEMKLGPDALARLRPAPGRTALAAPPAGATAPGPTAADVAAASAMTPDDRSAMIRSMVQRLADRLAQEPGDVDGWLRLGRAYAVLGEQEKSLDAFRRASEADPKRDDARQAYASARAALDQAK